MLSKTFGIKLSTVVLCLFALSQNDVFAQQITTPNGSRSMTQKGISAQYSAMTGSGVKIDISYNVSWEAKLCELPKPYGKTPKVIAWITNYTFESVEYRDESFSAAEIGQNTLKQGLEIVNLNSGIVAEVTSKENGKSEQLSLPDAWIPAWPQKPDVCSDQAKTIHHYELSRREHTIQIENTDQDRRNRLRISKDLQETITYKAIDKKMEKAKMAANSGNKDRAQQIAMRARNMCPGGGSFNSATECEIEISEFLKSLSESRTSENNEANNLNQETQSNIDSENENRTASNSSNYYQSDNRTSNNQPMQSEETEQEYREWESDYQNRVQSMLDEMNRQSEVKAQIRQQKMEAIEQAATNLAGMINQIQEQKRAERERAKYNRLRREITSAVSSEARKFEREAKVYASLAQKVDRILQNNGQNLFPYQRETLENIITECSETIEDLYKGRDLFLNEYRPEIVKRIIEIQMNNTTNFTLERRIKNIHDDRESFTNSSYYRYSYDNVDTDFKIALQNLTKNYNNASDEILKQHTSIAYKLAEVAKNLDESRIRTQNSYGYYTPYLQNGEEKMVDDIKAQYNPAKAIELIEAYKEIFPEGKYMATVDEIKNEKQEIIKRGLMLREEYLEKAEYHQSKYKKRAIVRSIIGLPTMAGTLGFGLYGAFTDDDKQLIRAAAIFGGGSILMFVASPKMEYHNSEAKKYRQKANKIKVSVTNFVITSDVFAAGLRIEF